MRNQGILALNRFKKGCCLKEMKKFKEVETSVKETRVLIPKNEDRRKL